MLDIACLQAGCVAGAFGTGGNMPAALGRNQRFT